MKWVVSLLLLLSLFFLWKKGSEESRGGVEVVKSTRVIYDAQWRAKPEREMTIRAMERYAAGLSDEELIEGIESGIFEWLERVKGLSRPLPPRLIIILAREVGKRHGEKGWVMVEDLGWDLEDRLSGEREDPRYGDFAELQPQLRVAAFGGFVFKDPLKAISSYLDVWDEVPKKGPNRIGGWRGDDQSFEDHFYVRLVSQGIETLAEKEPERAFQLVERSQEALAWQCKELVGTFLRKVPGETQKDWLERAALKWPDQALAFKLSLSSLDEVKDVIKHRKDFEAWGAFEYLDHLRDGEFFALLTDAEINAEVREVLAQQFFENTKYPISEVLALSAKIQMEVLENELRRITFWNDFDHYGPVLGEEMAWEQDRSLRLARLEEVLAKSALAQDEKTEMQVILDKEKAAILVGVE